MKNWIVAFARMEGMDKNMSAMRAEMDAVPKRFDAVETNLGRKISRIGGSYPEIYGKTVFPGGRRQKKRNVLYGHLGWKDKRSAGKHEYSGGSYYQNYSSTSVPSPSERIEDLKNSSNAFLEVSHILGACSLIRGVHS